MLIKVLFLAILFYMIFRATRNLLDAMRTRPSAFPRTERPMQDVFRQQKPSTPQQSDRNLDIEDARWEDL